MPKHTPITATPTIKSSEFAARNLTAPSPMAMKSIADGLNHVTSFQKKQIFARSQRGGVAAGASGTASLWRGYFRTSENLYGVKCLIGIADTDYASATKPYVTITARNVTVGAAVATNTVYHNGRSTASGWYELIERTAYTSTILTGLSENTEYSWLLQAVDGARPVYLSMIEIGPKHANDADESVVDAGKFVAEGPIYYQNIQDISDAVKSQWRHNAAHLLAWAQDYATPISITNTSYANLLDTSITAVAASSPGFRINTLYHNTTSRTTVPCRLAVRAIQTGGSADLDLRLTDGTNNIDMTVVSGGLGVENWYASTETLPAQSAKYDIHVKTSAANTWDIYAVSLFEWES